MYQAYSFRLFSRANRFFSANSVFMVGTFSKWMTHRVESNVQVVHVMRSTQAVRIHAPRLERYVPRGNVTTSREKIELSIRANSEYCEVVDKRRHTSFTKLCAGKKLGAAFLHFAANVSANGTRDRVETKK